MTSYANMRHPVLALPANAYFEGNMTISTTVIDILNHTLSIDPETDSLTLESDLLGAIPEFDSMAVVSVITALEEELGLMIDDDELDAEVFATVESLVLFVEQKKEEV